MKLYNYWRSSCSWRARIALAYKNLPYEYVAVHLLREGGEQFKTAHRERNPMGQVPVLEVDEGGRSKFLPQSMAILEYLEERYPEPPLLPKDAVARAHARAEAEVVNSGIQPFQGLLVGRKVEALDGDKNEWIRFWVGEGLRALETMVRGTHGLYCVGDQVTFADCLLVPQLYAARRFSVPLTEVPALLAVEQECLKLPAFQVSHPDRQPDAET